MHLFMASFEARCLC